MESISNLLSSNVIRTLFFSIQSLFKIMFLKINFIYIIIRRWLFNILSWSFIYFLRMIFSFVIVLVSISYLIKMIFSFFFRVYILDIIVILISKSISFSFVTVLSSLSYIVIEKIIRFSNSNSSSFLRLSRFSIRRRLRE